ncbi:hypothetical protein Droror1_Dr00006751 [Drosera rotundifolia]
MPIDPIVPSPAAAAAAAFIKPLASCNAGIRSKALITLLSWLPTQSSISDDDMKKLWKSLFYSYWHCDKVQNQVNLADRLSGLLGSLPRGVSVRYFEHFWTAMRREWAGIDRLRLDKFYMLIRVFVRGLFGVLKREGWDLGVVGEYVGVLEERVMKGSVEDKGLGFGVSYHVAAIWCGELKGFLPVKGDVLEVLFGPFVRVLGRESDRVLVAKVRGDVFECLLRHGRELLEAKVEGKELDSRDEVVLLGTVGVVMRYSKVFYEMGSRADCVQGNRKVVFDLHKGFLKLEKNVESSGVVILIPERGDGNDDEEEVPQLIPLNGKVQRLGDVVRKVGKQSKKDKKASKIKKSKKKLKGVADLIEACTNDDNNDEMIVSNDENMDSEPSISLNEAVISNLQQQFEKIAKEAGLDEDGTTSLVPLTTQANGKLSKKRKRAKSVAKEKSSSCLPNAEGDGASTIGEKTAKKVKFSMKNNLVWKPHTPLPPQDLRIPPSVTPRGSALKKGVPPGPVREISPEKKKMKKKKSKKARKLAKSLPAVKALKKIYVASA